MKTSESLRFSDVFRGYRSGTLVENGFKDGRSVLNLDYSYDPKTVFLAYFTVLPISL